MNIENYNDNSFFLVWRNVFLRNLIIKEIVFFNNFRRVDFKINTNKEYQYWLDYPYKRYLKRVYFYIGGKKKINNLQRVLSILESLPENIDTVEIENSAYCPSLNMFKPGFIPRSVTSLEFVGSFYSSFSKDSIHSNIKSLILNDQITFKNVPFIQCLEGNESTSSASTTSAASVTSTSASKGTAVSTTSLTTSASKTSASTTSASLTSAASTEVGLSSLTSISDDIKSNKLIYLDFGFKNKSGYSSFHKYGIKKLPNNLKQLLFQDFYNEKLIKGFLPNGLISLTFGDDFNTDIGKGCLPSSITFLKFGYNFNCIIEKDTLPNELKILMFGELFNRTLNTECFLNTTKLEEIHFGREYEKPFNKYTFPQSLKKLIFANDCKFNHPLEVEDLPPLLETLILGEHCFRSQIKSLPTTLKHLSINCDQSIRNLTPFLKNLEKLEFTHLVLYSKKRLLQYNDLPISIKSLRINEEKLVSPNLQPPQTIKSQSQLILEEQSLTSLFSKQLLHLTNYEGFYNICLSKCNSLRSLKITGHFKDHFECDDFSTFIESIEFSSYKNERLTPKVFTKMKNLKSIIFDYHFSNPLDRVIFPNTITNIELGNGIKDFIDFKIFPNSLRSLKLGEAFNQLTLPNLPESLTCLSIGFSFKGTISNHWLKPSIQHLILFSGLCKFQFPLPNSTTIYTYYNNYNIVENQFYFDNLIKNNNLKLCTYTFINSLYNDLKNKIS
ncbi:hypothetical protein ACTA71_002783 [Dictyostelium dimigraforme]